MAEIKRQGRDKTTHKKAINEHDLEKMYTSGVLGDENPVALQRKVFFELSLHFGRRGRENWRNMAKDSFTVATDSTGKRYVTLAFNEFDKNHRQGEEKNQYMFSTPELPNCPVRSFEKYIAKLNPKCPAFLQRPDPNYNKKSFWYVNAPLGVHYISNMMKSISSDAGTSVTYTNHCVKATTGTVLKKAGFCNKDIMAVTGHKNVASLDSYIAEPDVDERAKMSMVLANFGKENTKINDNVVQRRVPSATVTSSAEYSQDSSATTVDVSCRNVNVSEACSSLFSGANFHGPVTINVQMNKS
jgi:hypothetical protein